MSRPDNYSIEKTVWRSGRKNNFGDELVVAEGKVNDKFSYVMAWESVSKLSNLKGTTIPGHQPALSGAQFPP